MFFVGDLILQSDNTELSLALLRPRGGQRVHSARNTSSFPSMSPKVR
jgi:hypothetical protein